MKYTITKAQRAKIADILKDMVLSVGMGIRESACSIAAINLALTGKLTDEIPDCMSIIIGGWIIRTQDSMPSEIRNSARWKAALPLAAGTGRDNEREAKRWEILLGWTFGTVLPYLQPIADEMGFGEQWLSMTTLRTEEAAKAEGAAAWTEAWTAARTAAWAAEAVKAAAWAAEAVKAAKAEEAEEAAARTAARTAAWTWRAAKAAAWAAEAAEAVKAAAWAAEAVKAAKAAKAEEAAAWTVKAAKAAAWTVKAAKAEEAAEAAKAEEAAEAAEAAAWEKFDPCGVLERLIAA